MSGKQALLEKIQGIKNISPEVVALERALSMPADWGVYDHLFRAFFKFHEIFDPSTTLNISNFFATVKAVSEGGAPFLAW